MSDSKKVKEKVKQALKNDSNAQSAYQAILRLCDKPQANK